MYSSDNNTQQLLISSPLNDFMNCYKRYNADIMKNHLDRKKETLEHFQIYI